MLFIGPYQQQLTKKDFFPRRRVPAQTRDKYLRSSAFIRAPVSEKYEVGVPLSGAQSACPSSAVLATCDEAGAPPSSSLESSQASAIFWPSSHPSAAVTQPPYSSQTARPDIFRGSYMPSAYRARIPEANRHQDSLV